MLCQILHYKTQDCCKAVGTTNLVNKMKKILFIIIAAALAYGLFLHEGGFFSSFQSHEAGRSEKILENAFNNHESGLQVTGNGIVIKTLSDDLDGSRHQRFILKLDSGQTLLIAHNIDLAPRINELMQGDNVEFHGEYKWNSKGGVIHWTHHDPGNKHVAGWLKHDGRTYQ
jgi:hypothetical protein